MALATQPTTNLFQNSFLSSKTQPRPQQLPTTVPCSAQRRSGSVQYSVAVTPIAASKVSKEYEFKSVMVRQIIDNRGNLTVEVDLVTDNLYRSPAPCGAFTGMYEALELRDGDKTVYGRKGVLTAVKNINEILGPKLVGVNVSNRC